MRRVQTLILGAGPAGLAAAASMRQQGLEFEVLDKAQQVGSSWRNHYDRLHLHTVKRLSSLPGLPMPKEYPKYPSRQQVVRYLEQYANHFAISPRFETEVSEAAHHPDGWHVRTQDQDWLCQNLVVATGYNAIPNQPQIKGMETFSGDVLHSSQFKNGAPWRGKRALVMGCGNSGGEIVLDLFEHGCEVSWVVRGPVHVTPRDLLGRGAQETAVLLSRLPLRVADRIAVTASRLVVGDLREFGIERPRMGPFELIWRHGRVSILDIGTVDLVKRGKVRVVPGVARFTRDNVHFVNGRTLPFDVVVMATGFRPGLGKFLRQAAHVTNQRGYPKVHGTEAQLSGLYFIGFANPPTGAFREMSLEAPRIAQSIAARA